MTVRGACDRPRSAADRPARAVRGLRHLEYFHDHVRFEHLLFDGTLTPGRRPAARPGRPGLGLEVKWPDAERHRVYGPPPA